MNKHDEHLIDIVHHYLSKENYQLDTQDFRLQLLSNQSYPSLKSITDTLDYFGIKNLAVKVPAEALSQLPNAFLAVLKQEGRSQIAQVQRSKSGVSLYKSSGTKEKISEEGFQQIWDGTIVAIESNKTENKRQSGFHPSLLLFFSFSLLALLFWEGNISIPALGYILLALAGSMVSYFIVREELGFVNPVTARICNSAALNSNCSEVIDSHAASLFKRLKLSDLSLSFFITILLLVPFLGINQAFFLFISLLSIPVIIYAIYSQAFVLKKWCTLCLAIAGIIFVFIAITFAQGFSDFSLNGTYFIKAFLISAITYFAWLYLKSLLSNTQKLQKEQINFLRFKRNENLFNTLLTQNPFPRFKELSPYSTIRFGNPDAPLIITAVTNPLCGYCGTALHTYDQILNNYKDQVQFQLIFQLSTGKMEQVETRIIQQVLALYQQNPSVAWKALLDWFALKNLESWEAQYGISEKEELLAIIQEHREWAKTHQIFYTPTTVIGAHSFPIEYDIEDLVLFVDELITKAKKQKQTEQVSA